MHSLAQSTVLLGALAILGGLVEGKTDLAGCTKYTTTVGNVASIVWFIPDTLEVCTLIDCGGGRAPPKSKPGCPLYQGPETVTPSFLESNPFKTSASASSSAPSTLATPTSSSVATTAGSGTGTAAGPGSSTTAGPGSSTAAGSGSNATAVSGTGATGGSGSAAITSPPTSKTGASSSPSAPAGSAAAPAAVVKGLPVLMGLAATVLFL
ncbi:hypothetical protein RB595_008058 [Gaeumannomyces hyphopodioides]